MTSFGFTGPRPMTARRQALWERTTAGQIEAALFAVQTALDQASSRVEQLLSCCATGRTRDNRRAELAARQLQLDAERRRRW